MARLEGERETFVRGRLIQEGTRGGLIVRAGDMPMVYLSATPEILLSAPAAGWIGRIRDALRKLEVDSVEAVLDLPLHVVLTGDPGDAPFRVYSPSLIVLSTHQLEGHARYTGLGQVGHLLLYLHLALMQRTALIENPLLIAEDLIHPDGVLCLLNHPGSVEEYALCLEKLDLCPGCREFYKCVSCENELISLSKYRNLLKSGSGSAESGRDSGSG